MAIEITMPRLSDTMERGTIIKWAVREGDEVSAGDVVADIETDKATMEMQVFDDGRVTRLLVPEGGTAEVGEVIAELEGDEASVIDDDAPAPTPEPTAHDIGATDTAAPHEPIVVEAESVVTMPLETGTRVSPVARRLAEAHGLDAASLTGSGPGGRVIKRDVLQVVEARDATTASVVPTPRPAPTGMAQAVAPYAPFPAPGESAGLVARREPVSNIRQVIARRLVESKTTIPHYQVTMTFRMDPLLEMRASLNAQLAPQQVKLSVNDFLVRCCAMSMHRHPTFNASWAGEHIVYHGEVNIGVAIALDEDAGGGLVVATIRDADVKSLRRISSETRHLAEKARTRGLTLEEMSDATFTLSNLGMFGVEHFTAIINPPNSAILAVGGAIRKPVVEADQLVVGHEMQATLSLDHRVIDGATAAAFLQGLKQLIEHPGTLLV